MVQPLRYTDTTVRRLGSHSTPLGAPWDSQFTASIIWVVSRLPVLKVQKVVIIICS